MRKPPRRLTRIPTSQPTARPLPSGIESRPLSTSGHGVLVGWAAFLAWGLVPLYWRLLSDVASDRIVCHRAIWCCLFVALVVAGTRGNRANFLAALRNRRAVWLSVLAGWLIGTNWFVFIWAVNNDHILESSLGYYLSPLVTVALGALILGERLPRLRWIAIGFAGTGVLIKVIAAGVPPYIALALCSTWGVYALIKRLAGLDTMTGLVIESVALLLPTTLVLFLRSDANGPGFFDGWRVPLLLLGGGPITALPLLCYAYAARRLTLATLGLMQYITPSITFALGVFLYREPFTPTDLMMFGFIWIGLVIYTLAPRFSPNIAAPGP